MEGAGIRVGLGMLVFGIVLIGVSYAHAVHTAVEDKAAVTDQRELALSCFQSVLANHNKEK